MKVKLIWEFRGMEAKGIADHHAKHLHEFGANNHLKEFKSGVETPSKYFSIAWLIVEKTDSENVIRILRPHKKQELDN